MQEIQEIFTTGSVQSKLLLHEASRRSIVKVCDEQPVPDLISLKEIGTIINENRGDKGREL